MFKNPVSWTWWIFVCPKNNEQPIFCECRLLKRFFFFFKRKKKRDLVWFGFDLVFIWFFYKFACECYFVCTTRPLCYQVLIIGTDNVSDDILWSQKKVVFEVVWLKWGGWYLKNLIFRRIKPCQMRKMSFSENHFLWKQSCRKKCLMLPEL